MPSTPSRPKKSRSWREGNENDSVDPARLAGTGRARGLREQAEQTLAAPDRIAPGKSPRVIYQRRYHDALLGEEMLLRLVVEETEMELVVVTVYKTSKIRKYD